MTDFPQFALVKKLNQQHPDFTLYCDAWQQISTLYQGGVVMRQAVKNGAFLFKNVKELPEVFATRQLWFSYTNLLGNVIGWYLTALFKQPPQFVKRIAGKEGEVALEIPTDAADFCAAFEKDCDRSGKSLIDFFRQVLETALLYRSAYIVIDTPAPDADDPIPTTLQQQKDAGLLNPFLVMYTPHNIINWETDAYGNLEWVIVSVRVQEQEFLEDPKVTDYWYYYDREQVALYEREVKTGNSGSTEGEEMATLSPGYPRRHALADQRRVPVFQAEVPEGLWLANRVFSPLINHLNQDNCLDFGLRQANLAQLVITDGENGSYEEPVTVSAVGYHHLPYGGQMAFLEPEGRAYEASQKRIDCLEERIYKACYLMDQARTNRSTPTQQSGVSKQQDKTPGRDALSGIGDVIRPAIQAIYEAALLIATHKDIEPDVRGFDFADKGSAEDMQLLESGVVIPVNSQRYEREISKKVVRLQLPDLNPEALDEIDKEIDDNPTPSMVEQQQKEEEQAAQAAQFSASLKAQGA